MMIMKSNQPNLQQILNTESGQYILCCGMAKQNPTTYYNIMHQIVLDIVLILVPKFKHLTHHLSTVLNFKGLTVAKHFEKISSTITNTYLRFMRCFGFGTDENCYPETNFAFRVSREQ